MYKTNTFPQCIGKFVFYDYKVSAAAAAVGWQNTHTRDRLITSVSVCLSYNFSQANTHWANIRTSTMIMNVRWSDIHMLMTHAYTWTYIIYYYYPNRLWDDVLLYIIYSWYMIESKNGGLLSHCIAISCLRKQKRYVIKKFSGIVGERKMCFLIIGGSV